MLIEAAALAAVGVARYAVMVAVSCFFLLAGFHPGGQPAKWVLTS